MATNGNGEGGEKINTDIITLTRFLTEEQTKHKEATGDFTYVECQKTPEREELTGLVIDYYAMPFNSHSRVSPTTSGERL